MYSSTFSLTSALDGGGWLRHAAAALPLGKRAGTHCTGRWVGPRAGVEGCGKFRLHRTSQSIASLYTDWPIPAHIFCNVLILITFGAVCNLRVFFPILPSLLCWKSKLLSPALCSETPCIKKYSVSEWSKKFRASVTNAEKSLLYYFYAGSDGSESAQVHVVTSCCTCINK